MLSNFMLVQVIPQSTCIHIHSLLSGRTKAWKRNNCVKERTLSKGPDAWHSITLRKSQWGLGSHDQRAWTHLTAPHPHSPTELKRVLPHGTCLGSTQLPTKILSFSSTGTFFFFDISLFCFSRQYFSTASASCLCAGIKGYYTWLKVHF